MMTYFCMYFRELNYCQNHFFLLPVYHSLLVNSVDNRVNVVRFLVKKRGVFGEIKICEIDISSSVFYSLQQHCIYINIK